MTLVSHLPRPKLLDHRRLPAKKCLRVRSSDAPHKQLHVLFAGLETGASMSLITVSIKF